jgi:predicted RNA-binding Zn ribbon-like protein
VAPSEPKHGYQFDLSGGALCLDFANTVSGRNEPGGPRDHLSRHADLIAFFEQSKLLSSRQAAELRARAQRNKTIAQRVLSQAIALRERLFSVFSAIALGKSAEPDDLCRIEEAALDALKHRKLVPVNGGYRWEWDENRPHDLDRILWPVAQSAADLLTSDDLSSVRECEALTCAWLFLDHSRNRSRRWCDMKVCGNRQKARRHYQRVHN